jgi:hypothetical protein
MPLMEFELHPEKSHLRVFGLALAAILAVLAWRWHWAIVIAAAVVAAVAVLFPAGLRWVYVVMLAVAYPLGVIVSWVVLAAVYYGVVTPVGWVARICGRDRLLLKRSGETQTYWAKCKATPPSEGYFHPW